MRLVSTSGLLVSGDQQVLGQGFEPIKGLYATGNNSGGRFPLGYNGILNGVSIGMCLALGYVLGDFLSTADLNEATTLGLGNTPPKVGADGGGPPA
jgi:predicted oxidoreductase